MKALIVSDSQKESIALQATAQQLGYDTIAYRWLLKALDNIEEISPQVVIINALEYPRHWKLFTQHLLCALSHKPKVILLVPENWEEEEIEKARILGVRGYVTATEGAQLEKLKMFLKPDVVTLYDNDEGSILFIHPKEGTLFSGSVSKLNQAQAEFTPDRPIKLHVGDFIADGSLKTKEGIKSFQAEVIETEPELTLAMR